MGWRKHGARERAREAKRIRADAGSTPATGVVAPAGVVQMGAATVQRQTLGARPHSPRYPMPREVTYVYDDTPYAPLSMVVRWVRNRKTKQ